MFDFEGFCNPAETTMLFNLLLLARILGTALVPLTMLLRPGGCYHVLWLWLKDWLRQRSAQVVFWTLSVVRSWCRRVHACEARSKCNPWKVSRDGNPSRNSPHNHAQNFVPIFYRTDSAQRTIPHRFFSSMRLNTSHILLDLQGFRCDCYGMDATHIANTSSAENPSNLDSNPSRTANPP
jgi:hypothetical protein